MRVIVSGGQTGADRGGLDAAIDCGIPHRGWCPAGRRSEDGPIPIQYRLQECASKDFLIRTELNVLDSEATIIFARLDPELTGGSARTLQFCQVHRKPHAIADVSWDEAKLTNFVMQVCSNIRVLNVAGSRESKVPGIQKLVRRVMTSFLNSSLGR